MVSRRLLSWERGGADPSRFFKGIFQVPQRPSDQKIPPQGPVAAYKSYQHSTPNTRGLVAGPSGPGIPSMPPTRVYHYVNPNNGDHVTSLLPPNHPEMVCLQEGSHVEETKFGLFGEFLSFSVLAVEGMRSHKFYWAGVLAAIFWFPLGIGLCILDRSVTCKRCGAVIKGRPGINFGGSSRRARR